MDRRDFMKYFGVGASIIPVQIKAAGGGFVKVGPNRIDCDTTNGDVMIELSSNQSVTVRKITADDHRVFIRTTGTVLTGRARD